MTSKTFIIEDPLGLHARPACDLVKEAMNWECDISITYKDKQINAKSIFEILSCAIQGGHTIEITASGKDEQAALDSISRLL